MQAEKGRETMNRLHGKATAVWGPLFMVFFVSAYFLSGRSYPTLDVDHSWQALLEFAAVHGLRFGRDIIFTYGPLGYLNTEVSQGHLLAQRIVFSLFWSGCVAASAVCIARRLSTVARLFFIAWFLIASSLGMLEQHLYLVLACCTFRLLDDSGNAAAKAIPLVMAMSVLALVKFTFFLAVAVSLAGITAAFMVQRQFTRGFVLCGTALVALPLCWVLTGQKLADLLPWITASMQITSGYSGAMGLQAAPAVLVAGLLTLLLFAIAAGAVIAGRNPDPRQLLFTLILSCYAFLTWKHGFVRAYGHVQIFFATFPLLFSTLPALVSAADLTPLRRRTVLAACIISFAVCLAGFELHEPHGITTRTGRAAVEFAGHLRQLRDLATGSPQRQFQAFAPNRQELLSPALLPTIRAMVGAESVDVLNISLWAAPANGMNYTPRPVVQGYSVYTPWLQEKNLAFFRSGSAPAYLLMDMLTIDNRFPPLDDAPALLHILGNYAPAAREGNFLLLKQKSNKPVNLRLVHEQQLRFGEIIDLGRWNKEFLIADIITTPTLPGHLANTLYQAPPVWLDLRSGTSGSRYRFVPATGSGHFLLSPAITNARDLSDLYDNRPHGEVASLRLSLPPWGRSMLLDTYKLRLYHLQ